MSRLSRILATSLVICSLGLLACESGGITLPGDDFNLATERQAMIARHNNTRAGEGVAPLAQNALLNEIALDQAQYMAQINDSQHEDAYGGHVNDRATAIGYNWVTIGENVGFDTSAAELYSLWLGSPPHLDNILDPEYTEIGVGGVQDGIYQYWCIVFGDQF